MSFYSAILLGLWIFAGLTALGHGVKIGLIAAAEIRAGTNRPGSRDESA